MPTYSSPGNYVLEKDFSEYAPAVNSSIAGVVGFASRGPSNKATLITSPSQLVKTFGNPEDAEGGQGLIGAIEILSKTNSIYYVRVEDGDTALEATVDIPWGVCPTSVVGVIPKNKNIRFLITATNSDGFDITPGLEDVYTMGVATGNNPQNAILNANSAIQSRDWPWTVVPAIESGATQTVIFVASNPGQNARISVSAVDGLPLVGGGDTLTAGVQYTTFKTDGTYEAISLSPKALGERGWDIDPLELDGGTYKVESLHTGAGYNSQVLNTAAGVVNKGIKIEVRSAPEDASDINVLEGGVLSEGYSVSFVDNGLFFEDVINTNNIDPVSDTIKASFSGNRAWEPPSIWSETLIVGTGNGVNVIQDTTTLTNQYPRFLKMLSGDFPLLGGANGDIPGGGEISNQVIASVIGKSPDKSGIYALDDDSLNLSMACVPGITEENIQNTLITLAETSQNFLAVVSPPAALGSTQKAVNWHNGHGSTRSAAINSSYAAIYWPWLKTFDVGTASDIYMDPAAYAVSIMCHTDAVSDPWFAPAGLTRGRLTKPTDVEIILNQGDRDTLYQPGNSINPIAKFAQDGIVIWGQKTAQRTPSALDRVNVRRMMIVIRKMILAATRSIVFEPNDPMTWNRVVNLLQPAMDDIRRRRGITEFRVVCDETTNTPLRIDRNEMWCRVLIKPTKTAEILVFELNLTGQSANLGG